jgi:beta-lactamase class A
MIQVLKKDWFYSCCLFLLGVLLTVGCTGVNFGSREVTSNRPTALSSEITTARTAVIVHVVFNLPTIPALVVAGMS